MKSYSMNFLDKPSLPIYFLIFFVSIMAFADRISAEDYPPDLARILTRGKLIVAMNSEDAPPFFMSEGTPGNS